jgi:hypothetical protein
MSSLLDTLAYPPFAANPPAKVDGKIVGLVAAILSALGLLFGLLALLAVLTLGPVATAAGVHYVVWLALIGLLVALVAGVMTLLGGWQMYQANAAGKRLLVGGLALSFLGNLVYGLGSSLGGVLFTLLVTAAIYYVVVISRVPGEQAPTTAAR